MNCANANLEKLHRPYKHAHSRRRERDVMRGGKNSPILRTLVVSAWTQGEKESAAEANEIVS